MMKKVTVLSFFQNSKYLCRNQGGIHAIYLIFNFEKLQNGRYQGKKLKADAKQQLSKGKSFNNRFLTQNNHFTMIQFNTFGDCWLVL